MRGFLSSLILLLLESIDEMNLYCDNQGVFTLHQAQSDMKEPSICQFIITLSAKKFSNKIAIEFVISTDHL